MEIHRYRTHKCKVCENKLKAYSSGRKHMKTLSDKCNDCENDEKLKTTHRHSQRP